MERFDKAQQKLETSNGVVEPAPTANGTTKVEASNGDADTSASPPPSAKRKAESDELSELDDASPAPKKVKKNKTGETDAQLAARLQAELNAVTGRLTRGGGAKRKAPIKKEKKTKKKSSAKVNSDDDSEVESGEPKPEREKKGGFHVRHPKPYNLRTTLTVTSETHESLSSPLRTPRRNPTLTPPNRQENLGIRQRTRSTKPKRQTPNHVR